MNNDLTLKVGFDIAKFQAEMNKTTGIINRWSTGVVNSLSGVAAGFTALAIGNFVLDVSKLAGEAQGVSEAFERLPNSVKLMAELKEATKGTVSELDLMKRSVMAANFGISLEALPKLLEFASIRAKQTGQSVDYLVDSIVTGIGRKSKLILDNLGISAVALGEAMHGVSMEAATVGEVADAVGKIAAKELENMGEMSENASTKLERLSANWVNLKVAIGEAANSTGVLGTAIDALSGSMVLMASKNLSFWEKLSALVSPSAAIAANIKDVAENAMAAADELKVHEQVIKEVDRAMASGNPSAYIDAQKQHIYYTKILAEYQSRLPKPIELTTEELEKQKKALEELNKKLYEQSELEREIRINKLERQLNPDKGIKGLGDIVSPSLDIDIEAFDSMNAALDGLISKNKELTDSLAEQRDALISQVALYSVSFGEMLASGDTFAQGMSRVSAEVVSQIGKMIMAQMIQKAIMDKSTDFNFFAKLALIGVAIGAATGLLRKIGRSGGGGGSLYGGGSGGSSSRDIRTESLGQRITLEFVGDAGKVLKQKISEQDRKDSRTRI